MQLWEYARSEKLVVVTKDADFRILALAERLLFRFLVTFPKCTLAFLFPREFEVCHVRDLFIVEDLYDPLADIRIGQGYRYHPVGILELQKQKKKRSPFKLPLPHGPTGKLIIIPVPGLLGAKQNKFLYRGDVNL